MHLNISELGYGSTKKTVKQLEDKLLVDSKTIRR